MKVLNPQYNPNIWVITPKNEGNMGSHGTRRGPHVLPTPPPRKKHSIAILLVFSSQSREGLEFSMILKPFPNKGQVMFRFTLLGTNISHLGKRKIIFKSALGWDMLVPWRVHSLKLTFSRLNIGRAPKGKNRIPSIHFQVRTVSFREGNNIGEFSRVQ